MLKGPQNRDAHGRITHGQIMQPMLQNILYDDAPLRSPLHGPAALAAILPRLVLLLLQVLVADTRGDRRVDCVPEELFTL
jgi:hypothetical protein